LASSQFIDYLPFENSGDRGHAWLGNVAITDAPFFVIRRPPISRRQLHLMLPAKGGNRRKYGGTVTRHQGIRKGDYVEAVKAGISYRGWCSGDTKTQISVSNFNWKRLGQFTASKVSLLRRSTRLICTQETNFSVAV
ncbi:MAG: RRXRR domain-containing protein, partial [Waterburya sp.]